MINLLPPEEKTKLILENRKRLTIVLGITLVIPLVCLILVLLSIRFYILSEVNAQNITLQQAQKTYQTPDFLMFKDIVQKDNKILTQLESFYKKEIYFGNALAVISSLARPQNLYMTSLSLARDKTGKIKVIVTGFSQSRDDLLAFQKNIESNPLIENPTFSPQSWVDPQNITFYLTFQISK